MNCFVCFDSYFLWFKSLFKVNPFIFRDKASYESENLTYNGASNLMMLVGSRRLEAQAPTPSRLILNSAWLHSKWVSLRASTPSSRFWVYTDF